ncbi:MAG: hypothetical protein RRY79_05710 [Clostridia bacterium]
MNFSINLEAFLTSLSIMWKGMVGIFIVIGVIYLCIWVLGKVKSKKTDKVGK